MALGVDIVHLKTHQKLNVNNRLTPFVNLRIKGKHAV